MVQALLGLLVAAVLLLLLLEAVAACVPLYRRALAEAARKDASALTEAHFEQVLRRTLDYTRGRIPELQIYLPRIGESIGEPAFSDREIQHMADVRALFAAAKRVRTGAALAILVALGLTIRRKDRRDFWGRILLWSAGWGLALAVAVAALALADFRWAFDQFHYLFFANDLWLLPLDSILITMLPMWQFARLAAITGAAFALLETGAAIAGRRLLRVR